MKKLVLLATLTLAALSARADLGDTYAQSCRRYGGKGSVYQNGISWVPNDGNNVNVMEWFYHNQCVCIVYTPASGQSIAESEVWRALQMNSRVGDTWHSYSADNSIEYANKDASLYGKLAQENGYTCLRICYASYLKRHQLLHDGPSESSRPPVEDSDGTPM